VSLAVTLVALLVGMGVVPVQHRPPAAAEARTGQAAADAGGRLAAPTGQGALARTAPRVAGTSPRTLGIRTGTRAVGSSTALPADSGTGRRVVFDISAQRVWLVGDTGGVRSTYLVSGSLTHNLRPGSYAVYSRSRWAVGVDDSGVMQYFVRFAHGAHAAIGFHSLPTKLGRPLQTEAQLGTPQSHGCIRQATPDAIRMWDFASVGTRVVVTA
jgi:hypothetical protein